MLRPSLMAGLNGISVCTASLNAMTVCRKRFASTPSSFAARALIVSCRYSGDLPDPVFIAQQACNLVVENLPRKLRWLIEDLATVTGIGIVSEVCPFVYKSFTIGVDQQAQGI